MHSISDTIVGMCTAGFCAHESMLARQQREERQGTFEAFIDGPAAHSGEEGEGGQEASQHNRVCGAIIAIPVLPKDNPYNDEDQCPQAMEQGREEA